ncbi:DNA helicase/exodeoxyribonuclease V, alpha subunit [Sulfurivirga caldicuralii]|uniref:RecBCD enzyme subunit RecD n=1 Tax=Sulfurivirga caldicuralii TaxID=364032 RepID=A0A1N6HAD1_9GAMM|nr:exodeoxyribonuclease V subunit alpha [Sulfurivirga caldicuralii]SIO16710.1 DNA helicase/exodeoxyribonuclease V, alpha subunit [Sulfurivirga caldicuralii]
MNEHREKIAAEKVGDPPFSSPVLTALLKSLRPADRSLARSVLGQLLEAQQRGDTAIPVDETTAAALRNEPWVSDGSEPAPVILHHNLAQFHIYWQAERDIAEALAPRLRHTTPAQLDDNFLAQADAQALDPEKLTQIERALGQSLTLLTGGPGTGKTTTLAWQLAALLRGEPKLTIALAAPTGKAAQRMKESLDKAIAHLPLSDAQKAHLQRLIPSTLHRLLGIGRTPQPRHDGDNPLPYDLIVVDEASMVDALTLAKLCRALKADTRLILMGDPNQLASVEAGNVLGDLVAALPQVHCRLQRSHRFNRTIGALADAVLAGEAEAAWAQLQAGDEALQVLPPQRRELLQAIDDGFADYLAQLQQLQPADSFDAVAAQAQALMQALSRFRILTALRHDRSVGANALNEQLLHHWRTHLSPLQDGIHTGQPILIQENDYSLRLYNGDMGIVLPWRGTPMAWFEDADAPTGLRAIPASQLPAWETAWAMTVHKAQGAEFERVLLLLPDENKPLLTRELVYTALTRAKKGFIIFAQQNVFEAAVHNRTRRLSGLTHTLNALHKKAST